MLVLTTMFINVSNNLPKTSYMKMMDVWLLFNLLYPFIVVLLHTYMDTLRNDEEREINHHGRAIAVDESKSDSGQLIKVSSTQNVDNDPYYILQVQPALISVHEKEELEAQKEFYATIKQEMGIERKRKLKFLEKLSI